MPTDTDEDIADSSPAPDADVDSSSTQGEEGAGSPPSDTGKTKTSPPKDLAKSREDLIASLTGGKKDEAEETEEVSTDDEDETADEVDDGEGKDPEPERAEKVEPEATGPVELSDEELLETFDKSAPLRTQKRIKRLLTDRRQNLEKLEAQKPLADYGKAVLDFCQEGKLSPDTLGGWLALGVRVHQNPNELPQRLFAEAERIAKARGIELPKRVEQISVAPEGLEDAILDGIADSQIAPEVGKKMLAQIRAKKATTTVEKPPVTNQPTQTTQQAPSTQVNAPTPQMVQYQTDVKSAATAMDTIHAKYLKQYPTDWAKIEPVVTKAMERYQGTQPGKWAGFFEEEIQKAAKGLAKPVTVKTNSTIRPSTTGSGKSSEQKTGRSALLDELTGRKRT